MITVGELIETLSSYDPETEVRIAEQPSWPFEYSIKTVEEINDVDGQTVVYIVEGAQLGYLPGDVCDTIGWD